LARPRRRPALAAILVLAAVCDFYGLQRNGYANLYYAAAIRSMLQTWHNFFFVSFDPGGFVSVDKPPLGFWIQAASAKLWGFSGFSILLPQALVGSALLALSLLVAVLVVIVWLLGIASPSAAGVPQLLLLIGGIQLISVGILGEYLGRIYDEVRNRPRFIVGEVYGGESRVAHADAVTKPLPVPVTAGEAATTPYAAPV